VWSFLPQKDCKRKDLERAWEPFLKNWEVWDKNGLNCEEYELRKFVPKYKPSKFRHPA